MYLPAQGITHLVIAAAGVAIAFVVGFVLTWLFWVPKKEQGSANGPANGGFQ